MTPICETSSVPATRTTVNGPSTGPGSESGSDDVGQITLVSSAVADTDASGSPVAHSGGGEPAGRRTAASAWRYWIRCTEPSWFSVSPSSPWSCGLPPGHSRRGAGERKPERLGQVEREVPRLQRAAGGPLGEVVDGGDRH